jgi:hypothetical protein
MSRIGSLRHTLLVVTTLFATGCIPAVNHGPQIESGWTGGLTAAYPLGPRYSNGDWGQTPFLYGPLGVNLGHGWRQSENGGAIQLGVHVPATLALFPPGFFEIAQADAYYQLPAMDAGFGVNLSSSYVMPYLQAGRIGTNGSGWYTTQGLSVMWDDDEVTSNGSAAIFWMPTIAYQMARPSHTLHWFVTGGAGTEKLPCYDWERQCAVQAEARYVLSAGVSLQFHRRK